MEKKDLSFLHSNGDLPLDVIFPVFFFFFFKLIFNYEIKGTLALVSGMVAVRDVQALESHHRLEK